MYSLNLLLEYLLEANILDNRYELLLRGAQDREDFVMDFLVQWLPLKEEEIKETISRLYNWPLFLHREILIDEKLPFWLDAGLSAKLRCIPLNFDGYKLRVAVDDPFFVQFWRTLEYDYSFELEVFLILRSDFASLYRQLYNRSAPNFEKTKKDNSIETFMPWQIEEEQDELVTLLEEAILAQATDIHFEPMPLGLRVRFRTDGVLSLHRMFPEDKKKGLIARLKVWCELNVSQQRLPQDGQFQRMLHGEIVDFRLSTLPLIYGEKAVLRILRKNLFLQSPAQLGLRKRDLDRFLHFLHKPQGMILVCGPTASGKTTTLYSALLQLPQENLNIVTIENPVEYRIPGIQQMQVNPQIGATFAAGLRAVLRQDPDVILVGEIRDLETAEVAFQSALTGHLVLASLHTEDAAGAITRLLDMGIEPYLITSAISCILAQRLVRKICPHCSSLVDISDAKKIPVPQDNFILPDFLGQAGKGCSYCQNRGYAGRMGIFEFLVPDEKLNRLIMTKVPLKNLRDQAIASGFIPLYWDGLEKAGLGLTSFSEILPYIPSL